MHAVSAKEANQYSTLQHSDMIRSSDELLGRNETGTSHNLLSLSLVILEGPGVRQVPRSLSDLQSVSQGGLL